jgi:hypothetical protein
MNPLIFFIWIGSILLGAGIGLLIIRRIKNRPPKPKPIESNILVDPSKVGEIIHRWNCFDEMLKALKAVQNLMEVDMVDRKTPEMEDQVFDKIVNAIDKATERKP